MICEVTIFAQEHVAWNARKIARKKLQVTSRLEKLGGDQMSTRVCVKVDRQLFHAQWKISMTRRLFVSVSSTKISHVTSQIQIWCDPFCKYIEPLQSVVIFYYEQLLKKSGKDYYTDFCTFQKWSYWSAAVENLLTPFSNRPTVVPQSSILAPVNIHQKGPTHTLKEKKRRFVFHYF